MYSASGSADSSTNGSTAIDWIAAVLPALLVKYIKPMMLKTTSAPATTYAGVRFLAETGEGILGETTGSISGDDDTALKYPFALIVSATNRYPRRGTVSINCTPPGVSPSAFRK